MTQKSGVGCIGNRRTIDGKRCLPNGFLVDEKEFYEVLTEESTDDNSQPETQKEKCFLIRYQADKMRGLLGKDLLAHYQHEFRDAKAAQEEREKLEDPKKAKFVVPKNVHENFNFIDNRTNTYSYATKKMIDKLKNDIRERVERKHYESYHQQMQAGKRFTMQELKEMGGKFHSQGIKNEIMQIGLRTAIEDIKN